jgi:hypothetical protein
MLAGSRWYAVSNDKLEWNFPEALDLDGNDPGVFNACGWSAAT